MLEEKRLVFGTSKEWGFFVKCSLLVWNCCLHEHAGQTELKVWFTLLLMPRFHSPRGPFKSSVCILLIINTSAFFLTCDF